MSKTRLTLAALGVFAVLLVCSAMGFCGPPADHQPKPATSSATK